MMKAKAEAEAKEMQAKGMKRGEDFLDCTCFISLFVEKLWSYPIMSLFLALRACMSWCALLHPPKSA